MISGRRVLPAASLVVLLALVACGRPPASAGGPKTNVITVSETSANVGNIASVFSYSAGVTPKWTVTIMPRTSGQIVELKVEQGQEVSQGAVIAVLDHQSLDDQVTSAKANLDSARAKLNSILAGARPEDVAAANANAAAAQAAVNNLVHGRPSSIAQAQANLDAANARLAQAQAGGRQETVQEAQAKLNADQASLNKLLAGPVSQDVTSARLAVQAAKDRLYADQTTYDRGVASGLYSAAQRQAALDVDQTGIDQANTALAKLVAPPRPEDVVAAKAAVQADQQALDIAKQPNTPADMAGLKAAVAQAQAALNAAKQPGSASQIAQAQAQAAAQQAGARKASRPYTAADIAQAQAAVEVQQAALQSAQTALGDATITAPAAGTISELPVAVGSLVGPSSPVATLISTNLEVDASVAEGQVGLFKNGEPATISVSSDPGRQIKGTVFLVAPAADPKTRKFTVKVAPAQSTAALRAGMSATVQIQTSQRQGVVLVPKDAVVQRDNQYVVYTDTNGRVKMNVVKTGLSDQKNTQILSGIKIGDKVILPGSINLAEGDAVTPAAVAGSAPSASASPSASGGPSPAPK
ncbi:MAG: efflux RND transporter periplasmic adaptor subunit [Chloroflexota bacterium]